MIIDIYYFSGTGNSLFIARNIAEKSNEDLLLYLL
jgi:flavodoxin